VVSEFEARRQIVEIGRRLWQRGYVAANDGNLSVRLPDGRIVVTPSGGSKGFLDPTALVVVNAAGARLSGRLAPTSELAMHLFAYARRPDVHAVVHAHPPKATGFSAAGVPLARCLLPEVVLALGDIPTTDYATPTTEEVPDSIAAFIADYSAMILRRHGVVTLGADIEEAYARMETVEHVADIALTAKILGGAPPLSNEEVRKLMKVREKLGVRGPAACAACGACDQTPPGPAQGADEEAIVRAVIERVRTITGRT